MKTYKKLVAIIAISLVFSCQKEDLNESITHQQQINSNDPVVQKIMEKGWKLSQIKPTNKGFYLVGKDFLYSTNIEDYDNEGNFKQAKDKDLVDKMRINNMIVFVDPTLQKHGDWKRSFEKAAAEWNKIQKSSVNFTITDKFSQMSKASILVFPDDGALEKIDLARADLPQSGKPGNSILINTDYINLSKKPITHDQRVLAAAHELGHTIGLEHTNWKELGEPQRIHILGTPEKDPASIMNGDNAEDEWKGFSLYDTIAIRTLYPE